MCGISGIIQKENKFNINIEINKFIDTLKHRGPDNKEQWVNIDRTVALGHNRLSIIDLSKNGNQPMISDNGRYVITFNGEIYNYRELKKKNTTNRFRY